MTRALPAGYELDDDPERIDLDAVHRYLCDESYWARGRSRDEQEQLNREATRVVGLYRGEEQVGFARVTADAESAFLYDVFVLPEHRGNGLGVELVREAVENGPHAALEWGLRTADAHGLYRRFGFREVDALLMERPAK